MKADEDFRRKTLRAQLRFLHGKQHRIRAVLDARRNSDKRTNEFEKSGLNCAGTEVVEDGLFRDCSIRWILRVSRSLCAFDLVEKRPSPQEIGMLGMTNGQCSIDCTTRATVRDGAGQVQASFLVEIIRKRDRMPALPQSHVHGT